MSESPSAAELLTDIMKIVCDVNATPETRRKAVMMAFELGKGQGRCEGAASMGQHMMESVNKGLDRMVAAIKS